MERIYIKKIHIDKVRHLSQIDIPLADNKKKHLVLTGQNGSGKTSLLDAMKTFIDSATTGLGLDSARKSLESDQRVLQRLSPETEKHREVTERIDYWEKKIVEFSSGVDLELNQPLSNVYRMFQGGQFVVAYHKAERAFQATEPKHVEKVQLKEAYSIQDTPRTEFLKYLLDMKATEGMAVAAGKKERAEQIHLWFERFQTLLQKLFEDDSLRLEIDLDTFHFSLEMKGREPFGFNTLASGYSAILDIVADLILRMEKHSDKVFDFNMPGIVLIDEIETHLHLEMQRKILPLLTTLFPNIQFIVSTHSPFILNSMEDVVIYDLESGTLAKNGLSNVPYDGIVEGYFKASAMSDKLRAKFERYKELANQTELSDENLDEIADLELYLDEIPDYLALEITTEYQELKQKLRARGNI